MTRLSPTQALIFLVLLAGLAGPALATAQDVRGYGLWVYTEGDRREIPTNRWFWVEIAPGLFAPKPMADARLDAADEDAAAWQAELTQSENWVAYAARNHTASENWTLYCVEWRAPDGTPRLSCFDTERNE